MKQILKTLWTRLTCRHLEYEFLADFNMRHVETNRRYHDVTIVCTKCGKKQKFHYFREDNK